MIRNSKLKMVMFEKGVSQTVLAEETNIPRSYISLAIQGRYNFNTQEQQKVAVALECNPQEIFESQAGEVKNDKRTG